MLHLLYIVLREHAEELANEVPVTTPNARALCIACLDLHEELIAWADSQQE